MRAGLIEHETADERRYTQIGKSTDTEDTEDTKEQQQSNRGETERNVYAFYVSRFTVQGARVTRHGPPQFTPQMNADTRGLTQQ